MLLPGEIFYSLAKHAKQKIEKSQIIIKLNISFFLRWVLGHFLLAFCLIDFNEWICGSDL